MTDKNYVYEIRCDFWEDHTVSIWKTRDGAEKEIKRLQEDDKRNKMNCSYAIRKTELMG